MTLLALLDELDEAIGKGVNAATLRNRLSLIREQAEAVESQLEAAQLRIQELKMQLEQRHIPPKQQPFDAVAEKFLDQMFDAGRALALEQIAPALQLSPSMAQYHADILSEARMIEIVGITPAGSMFMLTPLGRAHVAKRR